MLEDTRTIPLMRAVARALSVSVLAGPDVGSVPAVAGGRVRIGASPDAELRLPTDPTVSRIHAELVIEEDGTARLRDLDSTNGTFIAGARVREAWLADGSRFACGATTLEVRIIVTESATDPFDGDRFGALLGSSPVMRQLFARMLRLVRTDEPVLVRGESGTGKELVARALHDASARADKPFVILDASAISGSLAEMELFGHTRGAFTGSHGERAGAFERAHRGTLFLDEIGELPLELQPRLLRAVEEGTVQRLGEGQRREVDVRLVAATHRPLAEMVNRGSFREDLYHRLSVLDIELPPLRTRGDDVARLAWTFLEQIAPDDDDARHALENALAARANHPWPGNVRELRNFVARIAILGELPDVAVPHHADLDRAEADLAVRVDLGFHEAKQKLLETFERRYLEHLLDETGGNVSEAARRSGLSRGHLSEVIARLGLRRPGRPVTDP
ncbi:MAG: sigma 54-interacting transcriptional regulator [Deltaproteobacteria bacterium]|jgi:two-component system nitrogen regulation response regulator GlnG